MISKKYLLIILIMIADLLLKYINCCKVFKWTSFKMQQCCTLIYHRWKPTVGQPFLNSMPIEVKEVQPIVSRGKRCETYWYVILFISLNKFKPILIKISWWIKKYFKNNNLYCIVSDDKIIAWKLNLETFDVSIPNVRIVTDSALKMI